MAKKSKKKKNEKKDFQKVKLKAGKTKVPTNATDTTLNVKSIQIVQHIKARDGSDQQQHTLPQVLSHATHHSPQMRKSALQILLSMIQEEAGKEFFKYSPITILSLLGRMLSDQDETVRSQCVKTLDSFYKVVEKYQHEEFHNQLLAHVNCTLTHPDPQIQLTGLRALTSVLLTTPLSQKLSEILNTGLQLTSQSILSGSVEAISFVDRVGKFSRQLAHRRQTEDSNESSTKTSRFVDCAHVSFSDILKPNTAQVLQSEFLTTDFYTKLLAATVALWPLDLSSLSLGKTKPEVLLKLIKTTASILPRLQKIGKTQNTKLSLERIHTLFPILEKRTDSMILKTNFALAKQVKNDEVVESWLDENIDSIKLLFTAVDDFGEVLEFFERFVDSEDICERVVMFAILKIKTCKDRKLQSSWIDKIVNSYLYETDALTTLFLDNVLSDKEVIMSNTLLRFLVDLERFDDIMGNVNFIADKLKVQKLTKYLTPLMLRQYMPVIIKNRTTRDILNLLYCGPLQNLHPETLVSVLLTALVRVDEFSTDSLGLVGEIFRLCGNEDCSRLLVDHCQKSARPLLTAKAKTSCGLESKSIPAGTIDNDLLERISDTDRALLNQYVH